MVAVICGEFDGKGGADAGSVGDDLLCGDGAGGGEVLPGGVGVVGHVELAGVGWGALAVAAVVEGEDVEAEVVEAGEGGDGVGEGAVGAGEEEDGGVGVAGAWCGGDPPAGELRGGGFVGAEVDELVGDAGDGGGCGRCAGWVQDELPLALVEEQAEGEVSAEESRDDGDGDGFYQPHGADVFVLNFSWRSVLVWFRSGAGHRSACFCIDFSIGLMRRVVFECATL